MPDDHAPPSPDALPPPDPPADRWYHWASSIRTRQVAWLWSGRIPLGKLTILDGDPGLGKSTLLLDLAARLSTGRPMPGTAHQSPAPGRPLPTLLLSAEDSQADTIRPRLDAAGADPGFILIVSRLPPEIANGPFEIPTHLDFLDELVSMLRIRLVIVDPLVAYLAPEINPHDDGSVRRALHPLAYRAERTGAAIVVVRHLSKQPSRNPLYRGGSIGLIGAARSGLLVVPDPADPTGARRIQATTKLNLGPPPSALAYRLVPAPNGVARIAWEGPTDHTAASLLADAARDPAARDVLDEARAVLTSILADGPVPAGSVRAQAARAGLGPSLLWRAKLALGVRSTKYGVPGQPAQGWLWSLPAPPPSPTANDLVGDAALLPPSTSEAS